jgi:allantoate deiminase
MHRLPFSREDREARTLYESWVKDLGVPFRTDGAGNLVARMEGRDPTASAVMTGSHLDTQPWGGRYDGIVGAVGSLEVLEALTAARFVPERTIELVVWAGEEGSGRFDVGLIGSRAMIGLLGEEHLAAPCHFTGRPLAELMSEWGVDLDRLGDAERAPGTISAVVELHVEQGPYLAAGAHPIGVVTDIAGNWRLPLRITGQQSHSGATPMSRRRDALCAAAEVILAAEAAAGDANPPVVATSGYFSHQPKVIAIVPGEAEMTMDVRSPDPGALDRARETIVAHARDICERRNVGLEVGSLWGVRPTATDEGITTEIEDASRRLGIEPVRMASWAGHDSMMLGKRFPAGMIFVPSIDGISHAPDEYSRPDDIATGVRVLTEAVVSLAERPTSHETLTPTVAIASARNGDDAHRAA